MRGKKVQKLTFTTKVRTQILVWLLSLIFLHSNVSVFSQTWRSEAEKRTLDADGGSRRASCGGRGSPGSCGIKRREQNSVPVADRLAQTSEKGKKSVETFEQILSSWGRKNGGEDSNIQSKNVSPWIKHLPTEALRGKGEKKIPGIVFFFSFCLLKKKTFSSNVFSSLKVFSPLKVSKPFKFLPIGTGDVRWNVFKIHGIQSNHPFGRGRSPSE